VELPTELTNPFLPEELKVPGDGLIFIDSAGYVQLVNSTAEDIFGVQEAEAKNVKLGKVITNRSLLELSRKTTEGKNLQTNIEIGISKPSKKSLSVSITPLFDKKKNYVGQILLFRDITEKSRFERQLSSQNQLSTIGILASWVAHEVRNPLTAINVHLELLKEEVLNPSEGSKEEIATIIQTIQSEVERLDNNVRGFLDFSKLPPLKREPTDLNQFIKSIEWFINSEAQQADVKVVTQLGEDLPRIPIDTNQLTLAIINLVKNSIQAMPSGGNLTITTSNNAESISLTINDEGEGIAPENMDKIFDFLFSTKPHGSGLGLPICRRIIKEHGAEISFESTIGKGSTFTISFPKGNGQ
jgi:PAS domain S-box-containing protein